MEMIIKQFVNSVYNSNTFLIHDDRVAVIVDLGDWTPVKEYLKSNKLEPLALLLTHTHYDHFYGLESFLSDYPDKPVYTSLLGKESLKNPKWNFSKYHENPLAIDSNQIKILEDGEKLSFPAFLIDGKPLEIEAIATPGHDHSCLTYKLADKLFTGDSYIPDVKVVDNFPKSDKAFAKEWYDRLHSLSATHDIYPGHNDIKPAHQNPG